MPTNLVSLILSRGLASTAVVTGDAFGVGSGGTGRIDLRPPSGTNTAIAYHLFTPLPVPQESGRPVNEFGSQEMSSADTEYTTIATWTVSDERQGALEEISLDSDDHSNVQWRVQFNGQNLLNDDTLPGQLTLPFGGKNILGPGSTVTVGARLLAASTTNVYANIAGNQFPNHIFRLSMAAGTFVAQETFNLDRSFLEAGIQMWAKISNATPLTLDARNVNGLGRESFHAAVHMLVTTKEQLEQIDELAARFGLPALQNDESRRQSPLPAPFR